MSFRFEHDESPEDGFRRIAREQVGKAIDTIESDDAGEHAAVHEVRKRCKKVRGLARLVRPGFPGYDDANAWFRETARELSDLRDATTLLETLDALTERLDGVLAPDAFDDVRRTLFERRESVVAEQGLEDRLDHARERLREGSDRIGDWRLDETAVDAVADGLAKTYGRARAAMDAAYDDPEPDRFHEWRKRVKYHRYHARLLRRLWPPVLEPWRDETKHLSDLLGDEHDLTVLRRTLAAEPERFEDAEHVPVLRSLAAMRRQELRDAARPLGRRLFAEKPKHHARRHERLWRTWRTA